MGQANISSGLICDHVHVEDTMNMIRIHYKAEIMAMSSILAFIRPVLQHGQQILLGGLLAGQAHLLARL